MRLLLVLAVVGVCVCDRYHPELAQETRASPTGATPAPEERNAEYWVRDAQESIERRLRRPNNNVAKNVVMFLGDGMSVPTLAAARTLLGQRQGHTGEEAELAFEKFPTVGLTKTYCVNHQIADSACTATAYLCGVKTNYGTLGVTAAVPRHDCTASLDPATHVASIAEWALADGRDAGIVTTARITHASPGGAYAKTANRNWENDDAVRQAGFDPEQCPDIAHQLVHNYPGKQFKVILGGGRREFINSTVNDIEGSAGLRSDGRDLIEEWQASKEAQGVSYAYVWNRTELMKASSEAPEYLLGLFESSHMQYNLEADDITEPTLTELTKIAINSLKRNEKGFFLFVEAGRIDHAHHANRVHMALDETIEFSSAVAAAQELLSDDDSLLVVTSDHAHVMAFNGYTPRGGAILGPSGEVGDDNVPYMTLSYTNGPGYRQHQNNIRPDVTSDNSYGGVRWRSHADVPLGSETHGGDDVAVFASGPQHQLFSGLYEQSHVPHLMAYAACIGPGRHACDDIDSTGNHANSMQYSAAPAALIASLLLILRH